jgi:hypothetical protein
MKRQCRTAAIAVIAAATVVQRNAREHSSKIQKEAGSLARRLERISEKLRQLGL